MRQYHDKSKVKSIVHVRRLEFLEDDVCVCVYV